MHSWWKNREYFSLTTEHHYNTKTYLPFHVLAKSDSVWELDSNICKKKRTAMLPDRNYVTDLIRSANSSLDSSYIITHFRPEALQFLNDLPSYRLARFVVLYSWRMKNDFDAHWNTSITSKTSSQQQFYISNQRLLRSIEHSSQILLPCQRTSVNGLSRTK